MMLPVFEKYRDQKVYALLGPSTPSGHKRTRSLKTTPAGSPARLISYVDGTVDIEANKWDFEPAIPVFYDGTMNLEDTKDHPFYDFGSGFLFSDLGRLPPPGVHLSSRLIGHLYLATQQGRISMQYEDLHAHWPFARKEGSMNPFYRPTGRAFITLGAMGKPRYGCVAEKYVLYGGCEYEGLKALGGDDPNKKHAWGDGVGIPSDAFSFPRIKYGRLLLDPVMLSYEERTRAEAIVINLLRDYFIRVPTGWKLAMGPQNLRLRPADAIPDLLDPCELPLFDWMFENRTAGPVEVSQHMDCYPHRLNGECGVVTSDFEPILDWEIEGERIISIHWFPQCVKRQSIPPNTSTSQDEEPIVGPARRQHAKRPSSSPGMSDYEKEPAVVSAKRKLAIRSPVKPNRDSSNSADSTHEDSSPGQESPTPSSRRKSKGAKTPRRTKIARRLRNLWQKASDLLRRSSPVKDSESDDVFEKSFEDPESPTKPESRPAKKRIIRCSKRSNPPPAAKPEPAHQEVEDEDNAMTYELFELQEPVNHDAAAADTSEDQDNESDEFPKARIWLQHQIAALCAHA
ncbi:uncharacterized protein J3D65DRAFT_670514 [Phyllosticta citribraziliensis]|uniref:Uncharacterized protein n=1 Tax=Phyllosticta citribraziliensis TaxID=989973 RepID=A0ABR1LHW9_9PEZI